ncbi:MAG: hypothetical protein HRK26_01390 [Rickettsiaceae bacterium H1]|nr:hypothetical protein [Rickettsiaceae bacterium H1]
MCTNAAEKGDNTFSLMSLAVVSSDFQNSLNPQNARGFNIGSVIVDSEHNVVFYGLNKVFLMNIYTAHEEVEAIEWILSKKF